MTKSVVIIVAAAVAGSLLIGAGLVWYLMNQPTSPTYLANPAAATASITDRVRNLPCGRADNRTPVTVGAWILDDPLGSRNRAVVAIKARLASSWLLIDQAPDESPYQNLEIDFQLPSGVWTADELLEPPPAIFQLEGTSGTLSVYGAIRGSAPLTDDEGYYIFVFQQPIEWSGADRPNEINVRFTFQALSGSRESEPMTYEVSATQLTE